MKKFILTGAVAVAVGAATFATVSSAVGSDSPGSGTASQHAPRISTLSSVGDTLSSNALAEIKSRDGSFTPSESSGEAKVTLDTALKTAGGEFNFLNDAKSVNAQLGVFTDGQYGKELEADPTKPSRIDPLIKDRLVWLIEIKGFTMPSTGFLTQASPDTKTRQDVTGGSDGLFVVDALTGEVILGNQYSAYPQDNVGD